MSAKDLSFNKPNNGLRSTAMMSLSQPRTKSLALYKAFATANSLPSTGEYLDSASLVNLPQAKTSFQPSTLHLGWSWSHSHHFWRRKNPIPCLLQSVARQVCLPTSKCLTPSVTALMISPFANSNFSFSSSVHLKSVDHVSGFSKCLKGSMTLDILKLKLTC